MSKFLTLLITGGVTGALYSLIASGLVLSYSATGIFNLGYGAVAFTSALLYYELHTGLGWPIAWAAIVTIGIFCPLLGYALDRAVFRNLTRASESSKVMATVGILIALPAMANWLVDTLVSTHVADIPTGNDVYLAPGIGPAPAKTFNLGDGVHLTSDQVIVFIVAAVCAVGLWLMMQHTAIGLRMRAVVDRPVLAQMRGIDQGRTSATAWIVGTTLAGVVGVVGSPIFNSLDATTYALIMFVAIAAAVLGGLRSIPLAFAGGIFVGILQNIATGYTNISVTIQGFNAAVPFLVLLVGMVVMGLKQRHRVGSVVDEIPPRRTRQMAPIWRQALPLVVTMTLVLGYIEFVADSYWTSLAIEGLALSIVFLSFTIVVGTGGLVSLAQAAFVTASGLMTGMALDRFGIPWIFAGVLGIALSLVLGVLVALAAMRLGGLSFALASLALAFLGDQVLFAWPTLSNGPNGWDISQPLGLSNERTIAAVLTVIILVVCAMTWSLRRSLSGRVMFAVRNSEIASAASGISVPKVKVSIFALSAGLAGLGGFLLATSQGTANNQSYTATVGLVWIATVVLWGVRRSGAAIIAGLTTILFPGLLANGFHLWPWLPSWLSWGGTKSVWIPNILFGLGAIQMARDPDGILTIFNRRGRNAAIAAADSESSESPQAEVSGSPVGAVADTDLDPFIPAGLVNASVPASGSQSMPSSNGKQGVDPAILSLSGIWAGYGDAIVLRNVDLHLPKGTITALVGANGAGKSTLASVIAGVVPVSKGCIEFDNQVITDEKSFERARKGIISVPEARGIFPSLSVDENLTLRLPRVEDRADVYRQFPVLGERRNLAAGNLSGGEQQILALSSILVDPPALLVADEPTLGLAPMVVEQIMGVVRQLRDKGVTVLLIEEKAHAVLEVADYVGVLELGQLLWMGPRETVDEVQLTSAFLGREGGLLIAAAEKEIDIAVAAGHGGTTGSADLLTARAGTAGSERGEIFGNDPMRAQDPLLSSTDLVVQFGGVKAVNGVSVQFPRGEVCGLIGPNGAGKTTLFDTLAGLNNPSKGSITFDGQVITDRSATWRARQGIRRTFQRQQPFGWLSVEENILVAMEWRGGGGGLLADMVGSPTRSSFERERQKRVAEVMELCGITSIRNETAGLLSIGQIRSLELARAIVDHPRLLLLDEPTSGLEHSEVDRFSETIQRLRASEGCAVVIVEHDVGFIMENCDRVIVLNRGEIVAEGTPEETRGNAIVAEAYLGYR